MVIRNLMLYAWSVSVQEKHRFILLINSRLCMSIETDAKKLALLQKKKSRLQSTLNKVDLEVSKQQEVINKKFSKLGLDTNFS